MTLREALVILDLSERTLEPSMLNISLKNRLEKTDLRNVTRVLEAYRKVNSFLNPTLDTQGDSKGTVIDEPVEDGPPIQTTKSAVSAVKSETGLRRDYVPTLPNPTLLGASGHYENGNSTVMIDPSDEPYQQIDTRQTSIVIDDYQDSFQTPAPRVNSRQLAPLAVVGLGLLAFALGLGGMAVISKLVNPLPSIAVSVTDPVDPNTTVAIKPSTPGSSSVQNPDAGVVTNPENTTTPTQSVNPTVSNPTQNTSSSGNGVNQTTPSVPVVKPSITKPVVKPSTVQNPTTPEIAATVKPTKTQAELAAQAQAKATALEKARQAQLEKSRLAQVEKARLETVKAAQEKNRQAELLEARVKANKLALEKARQTQREQARQTQIEKARQAQLNKARENANAQALAVSRAKAADQARVDARIKARQQARAKAAQQARAKATAQAKARADQRARVAAQARAKARAQSQAVVVNSSARNLANNRSQFYAWDRNGAVLRYGSWNQIPQSVKTARAGTFRASVFVAASPSSMPDIKP